MCIHPMCESLIVTHMRWDSRTEIVSEDKSRTSGRSRWGDIKGQGYGIERDQKLVHFSYHITYYISWIWTRNTHLSSVSIICAMFDLIGWLYLSPKIHMSRHWSLDLPVPRWHRGLDELTPGWAGFLEIHAYQKVSSNPSDHLFWAPSGLVSDMWHEFNPFQWAFLSAWAFVFCRILSIFPGFLRDQRWIVVSDKVNMKKY
jgi:hypothetical protein